MASHVDKHAPAIELEALTKYYGSTRGIDELDLTVDRGEVMGFIGPNGAGKTTAIRVMLDFIRPTSGAARVLGLDSRAHALELRHRVGYLPAELAFFDALTTTEYVRWLERVRECPPDRAFELAERLGLDTSRRIGELSSGNRRKVGLVQALLHRPELVILDEPTAGLDPIVQREFRRLVAEARDAGTTVFMSSHILCD